MDSKYVRDDQRNISAALSQDHEDIRAELVTATTVPGPIGETAKRVAQFCLPHLELEEETAFPVFTVLQDLTSGDVHPETEYILLLIARFRRGHGDLIKQHQSIASAIQALWEAAYEEGNREIAEFARNLRRHEKIEDELLFPAVLLVGKYFQEALHSHGRIEKALDLSGYELTSLAKSRI